MRWWRHSRWSNQWSINQISLVKTAQIYCSFEELSQFISLCTYFTPLYNFNCLPHALCICVSRQWIQPELDGWPPSLDENTSMKPVLCCCIHRPTSAPCCKWCSSVVQYYWWPIDSLGLLGGSVVKNSPAHVEDARDRFDPWVGKIPWRRRWQPTSVFLPGKSHGQRSLVGYSPWSCKVLDMTEYANGFFIIFTVHVIFFLKNMLRVLLRETNGKL